MLRRKRIWLVARTTWTFFALILNEVLRTVNGSSHTKMGPGRPSRFYGNGTCCPQKKVNDGWRYKACWPCRAKSWWSGHSFHRCAPPKRKGSLLDRYGGKGEIMFSSSFSWNWKVSQTPSFLPRQCNIFMSLAVNFTSAAALQVQNELLDWDETPR